MSDRATHHHRPIHIQAHPSPYAEGSALITLGKTQVLCSASIEEKLPPWLAGKGKGWLSAEYDMLPRSTHTRKPRDSHKGKINGRTQEISRLIGRSLRASLDMSLLGERGITIDCDVMIADGGTRTAAITGGYVALALAIERLQQTGKLTSSPLRYPIVAISAGMIDGKPVLDLDYALDSRAEMDVNFVLTGAGELVEIQGTAEHKPCSLSQLQSLLAMAHEVVPSLLAAQSQALSQGKATSGTSA